MKPYYLLDTNIISELTKQSPNQKVLTKCAHVYADIYTTCSRLGFSRPYSDTQIAATAKSNAMILVTRNTKDFQVFADHCYLPIENWFEE